MRNGPGRFDNVKSAAARAALGVPWVLFFLIAFYSLERGGFDALSPAFLVAAAALLGSTVSPHLCMLAAASATGVSAVAAYWATVRTLEMSVSAPHPWAPVALLATAVATISSTRLKGLIVTRSANAWVALFLLAPAGQFVWTAWLGRDLEISLLFCLTFFAFLSWSRARMRRAEHTPPEA